VWLTVRSTLAVAVLALLALAPSTLGAASFAGLAAPEASTSAFWVVGWDRGAPVARVLPADELLGLLGEPDACATLPMGGLTSCTGASGPHAREPRTFLVAGAFLALLGPSEITVRAQYAEGDVTMTCLFPQNTGAFGPFFFPPSGGTCSAPQASGNLSGPWVLKGTTSATLPGFVVHVVR